MSSKANVSQLLKGAAASGELSPRSLAIVNVSDIGAQIQAGLGISVDDVETGEVVVLTILVDDSGSIRFAGNSQVMRDGHNMVIKELGDAKQVGSVIASTRYFNGFILFPYSPLSQAVLMDDRNYNPNGGTPLYDQSAVTLASVIAKRQEFADAGVQCRTITLLTTDGNDEHSPKSMGGRGTTPADVASIVKDMLMAEMHIIAAMGIDDGKTNFRKVFGEMGIPEQWILTPGNRGKDIRAAFRLFSQSAVRASQSARRHSQVAAGGFGTP